MGIQTACGNCLFCHNGQCNYVGVCDGTKKWSNTLNSFVPITYPTIKENEMREVENKTINPIELLDVFCEENCQNKWVCDAQEVRCPTYLLLRKWIERMEIKNGKIEIDLEDL